MGSNKTAKGLCPEWEINCEGRTWRLRAKNMQGALASFSAKLGNEVTGFDDLAFHIRQTAGPEPKVWWSVWLAAWKMIGQEPFRQAEDRRRREEYERAARSRGPNSTLSTLQSLYRTRYNEQTFSGIADWIPVSGRWTWDK